MATDGGSGRRKALAKLTAQSHRRLEDILPEINEKFWANMGTEKREALEAQMKATSEMILDRFSGVGTTTEEPATAPPSESSPKQQRQSAKPRRASAPELIVKRALRRHRKAARTLLSGLDLTTELKELTELEAELNKGTPQACKHASYRARNLIEGLADCLYPPTSKTRKGRDGKRHSLGSKDFKNRLIAYVEDRLSGKWESHDFRSFVATLDTVMRWTGSGPHGVYDPHEAEHMYPRLLDALAVLARAHGSD